MASRIKNQKKKLEEEFKKKTEERKASVQK